MDIEDIARQSREFIDSLDRTPLGRFAVDHEALCLLHVAEFYWKLISDYNIAVVEYSRRNLDALTEAANRAENTFLRNVASADHHKVYTELHYWWSVNHIDDHYIRDVVKEPSHLRLLLVAESPEWMHDYFAAGIWDAALIERCRADGIDAQLAASVL